MAGFRHPSVNGKGASPVAVLLTVGNERGILVKLSMMASKMASRNWNCFILLNGLPSASTQNVPCRLSSSRGSSPPSASARRPCIGETVHGTVREHHIPDRVGIFHAGRDLIVDRFEEHLVDERPYVIPDGVKLVLDGHARLQQLFAERRKSVLSFPGFHFLLRAVEDASEGECPLYL